MIGTFPGKLTLVEGDEVDVDLEIAGGRLRLTTGVSEIGSWPLDACLITALATGGYELTLDGEHVSFVPDHPDAFSAVVAAMTPVQTIQVPQHRPPDDGGYDLEAALDQVLGGNEDYEVPGLAEESVDDIAVTLEALFATAYSDFDEVEDVEPQADADADAEPSVAQESEFAFDEAPVHEIPDDVAVHEAPVDDTTVEVASVDEVPAREFEEPSPFAASSPGWLDIDAGESDDAVAPEVWLGPESSSSIVETGPFHEAHGTSEDVPSLDLPAADLEPELPEVGDLWTADSPAESVMEIADDQAVGPGSFDRDQLGARWRPGHDQDEESAEDLSSDFDDGHLGEEPESSGWQPEQPSDPPRFGRPRPSLRPAANTSDPTDFGGSGNGGSMPPRDAYVRDSGFDLEGAAASAGHGPGDDIETIDDELLAERVPARRGIGGMFSKSAGERFSAVSGAMRERTDGEVDSSDDDELSVADQIIASQEQLRSGSKMVRFTPAVVKRVTIGLIIAFVISGLILISPTVIAFLVDRVESTAQQPPVPTTLPEAATTVPTTPPTTIPAEDAANPGDAITPVATSVFELSGPEFAERWNSTARAVSSSLAITSPPSSGAFGLGFTRYAGLEGVVGGTGNIDRYTVVVDPLGDPQDDQLGIQALGVAITVAEPESTGADLRQTLLDMGLDVTSPDVEGLGGSLNRGEVSYELVYDEGRQLIRLTVSRQGAEEQAGDQP
jgi:hypothetical protein